jgi:hypothetical protein
LELWKTLVDVPICFKSFKTKENEEDKGLKLMRGLKLCFSNYCSSSSSVFCFAPLLFFWFEMLKFKKMTREGEIQNLVETLNAFCFKSIQICIVEDLFND